MPLISYIIMHTINKSVIIINVYINAVEKVDRINQLYETDKMLFSPNKVTLKLGYRLINEEKLDPTLFFNATEVTNTELYFKEAMIGNRSEGLKKQVVIEYGHTSKT